MKKILLVILLFTAANINHSFANSGNGTSPLLSSYYELKNALVGSNQQLAAQKAAELTATVPSLDIRGLAGDELKTVKDLQIKLSADAKAIAGAKDLVTQRNAFSSLSFSVYALAKVIKLSDQTFYYDFCPMKKSYWLSSEAAIKNPYYGNQMLTCGSVKDTINP